MFPKIKEKLIPIVNDKYFNEFYAAIFMVIALFSWRFDTIIGMSIMLVLSAIILILLDDFNYILSYIFIIYYKYRLF